MFRVWEMYYCGEPPQLHNHQRTRTKEHPYPCPKCGKCFIQKEDFKGNHTGECPYSCSDCGKCFLQKVNLKYRRTHTVEQCGKCFALKEKCIIHRRIRCDELLDSLPACRKCFLQKEDLKYQRNHAGECP
ncbi:hypothetical protein AB205_0032270 [Aquarana catesbeiana]|uniref:C2H2-type domain-containing protein n=1 Tax=Aquarana catesbeiana TaxID=8400 RepID=A0A2G9RVV1_AQUCT|nr:hypothetical protein AB205_0032270 [Aquarana catesbeiana]